MVHRYPTLLFLLVILPASAQTTFAPIGAHWVHESSSTLFIWPPSSWPYPIRAVRDTTIDGRSCSVLRMPASFYYPFQTNTDPEKEVILTTSGDSLLLHTSYDSSFHPLMVFSAVPGDTWRIPLTREPPSGTLSHDTITYEVEQIDTLWHMNMALRRVRYHVSSQGDLFRADDISIFVERIGDLRFLFPWEPSGPADHDAIHTLRCYSDDVLRWPDPAADCTTWSSVDDQLDHGTLVFPTLTTTDGPVNIHPHPGTSPWQVEVLDLLGRPIMAPVTITGNDRLHVPHRGTFLLRLRSLHAPTRTYRLIVQ